MGKSIYDGEIIMQLRDKGLKNREISEIVGCGISLISYYTNPLYREKQKERNRNYWIDGKSQISQYKSKNREFVQGYLKTHPCIDCGNSDIRVLEFDHVRGIKKISISQAVAKGWGLESIKEEIEKCEVRCANCHRIVTKERNQYKPTKTK